MSLHLGKLRGEGTTYLLPPHHLVTHGVVVGMTGSGKTGLCVSLVEEAVRNQVPVLVVDIKGDLPNLALTFTDPAELAPFVDEAAARRRGTTPEQEAKVLAEKRREGLAASGLGEADVRKLREAMHVRVLTPGTQAGEPLHVLSPLEQATTSFAVDEEAARDALSSAVSLLLRLVEREAEATSPAHVLLSTLAERRLRAGQAASLEALLEDLKTPPMERIGALAVDEFFAPKERGALATDLNALVAAPTFAAWRRGAPLDVGAWLAPRTDGKVPVVIVSVAHLDDQERALVLSLVLEQTLGWVRGLPGTTELRAMVLFDEVFGFLPPHPSNPPTKRPLLALLKQARAFGVGCVLATQNPIDLDYKALSNAGVWFVGRLQTDADRERVVEGLAGSDAGGGESAADLGARIKALPARTFLVRDVHAGTTLEIETRHALSWLRGPMTRAELRRLVPPPPPTPVVAPVAVVAPTPAAEPAGEPSAPEGWRVLFPHPPAAPVEAWTYVPHAGILARAELSAPKLGFSTTRVIGKLAPLTEGGLDLSRAVAFAPDALEATAVEGARFALLPALPARALRAIEKALREAALDALEVSVMVNDELGLVSQEGEAPAAFADRCSEVARGRAAKARAELLAKHEPKVKRLAQARDAAHRSAHLGREEKKRLEKAQAALDEAVHKRDATLMEEEGALAKAPAATYTKQLAAKKSALVVEGYALVWLAG